MAERRWRPQAVPDQPDRATDLAGDLLLRVARGDDGAFEKLYDAIAPTVWGLVRSVVRDHAQSEEVTQEVLVEVWRIAARFDPARGSAMAWVSTLAHRRAVDRVRSAVASSRREQTVADRSVPRPYDEVAEQAGSRLEAQRLRRCVGNLTELQRESVLLAFYRGYTYPEVATLLEQPLGTVKTRIRDAMIRLRDCLGANR
jgi:RNA polymerase sigma-70 factor (ECF subfamily)